LNEKTMESFASADFDL